MCLLCSPVFLCTISQPARMLPTHTHTNPFHPPGFPDLNFQPQEFPVTCSISGFSPNFLAPRSKAANFNLKGILNLRDIDAILPQLRPRRLQTWAHFAELALRLFRFHWGAAATAQGPGETATVDDSVTLSVVTTARGSQATRPSGGLVKTTPCPGLCHSASRRRMESVCGSGICVWARSSRSTDFSCLF